MPEFAERADAADARRAEHFAPAIEAALARREPPRVADPQYTIGPVASGPPAESTLARATANGRPRMAALQGLLAERGEKAFQVFVRRSDDRRLERTIGSDRGLKVIFGAMAQAYQPDKSGGFTGELQYELRRSDGAVVRWTVAIATDSASVRPGGATRAGADDEARVADFVRVAGATSTPARRCSPGAWTSKAISRSPRGWARCSASPRRSSDLVVVPRYDGGGFAALPATVARLLGVGEGGVALDGVPARAQQVVLVLLDAFGWRFFTRTAITRCCAAWTR